MTDVATSTASSPEIYHPGDFSVATDLTACSSLSTLDGNVTPSSDSGLGSEDEQLSNIYENIIALDDSDVRSLYDLTKVLSIDCSGEGDDNYDKATQEKEIRDGLLHQIDSDTDSNNNIVDSSTFMTHHSEECENLSLLLTSQNPTRIDVKTLKRSKVMSDININALSNKVKYYCLFVLNVIDNIELNFDSSFPRCQSPIFKITLSHHPPHQIR